MENLSKTRRIRQYIRCVLRGFAPADVDVPQESLLIRDGVYCGHRFRLGNGEAIWFVEEDEVKFYGPRGLLLRTLRVSEMLESPALQAA
ncbi:MAG TPA: hypothetical protein VIY86_07585 [Pirellulaceae bacterium]